MLTEQNFVALEVHERCEHCDVSSTVAMMYHAFFLTHDHNMSPKIRVAVMPMCSSCACRCEARVSRIGKFRHIPARPRYHTRIRGPKFKTNAAKQRRVAQCNLEAFVEVLNQAPKRASPMVAKVRSKQHGSTFARAASRLVGCTFESGSTDAGSRTMQMSWLVAHQVKIGAEQVRLCRRGSKRFKCAAA